MNIFTLFCLESIIEHVAPSSGQVRALIPQAIKLSSDVCRKQVFSYSLYLNVMNLGDSFKQLSKLFQSLGSVYKQMYFGHGRGRFSIKEDGIH